MPQAADKRSLVDTSMKKMSALAVYSLLIIKSVCKRRVFLLERGDLAHMDK